MQVILLYNYMLQALAIYITSAASELEADWRGYCSATHHLELITKWILINDSKY